MSLSTIRSKIRLALVLIFGLSLIIAGCGDLQGASTPPEGDDQYTSQDQALESGGEGANQSADDSDLELVALACPQELTDFVLFVTHTWDFSPNRDLEKMRVSGQTEPSSPCPFSVAGSTVIMEECHVPITNTGFVKGDNGMCDISSSGEALVSIEDASCEDGVITMTIVETINPDSGSGAMNCPNISQPYFPFFPYSRTTRSFQIKYGGSEATEHADPDLSGQFMYNKSWTIYSENMIDLPPAD